MTDMLTAATAPEEVDRLVAFIAGKVDPEPALVLASGGLDSDVIARLTARAVGPERLRLVTILQDDMNPTHLDNARELASDLGVGLVELDLRGIGLDVVYRLAAGDPEQRFDPKGLLDPARMKCSLRTVVVSSYQDRGYVVLGTSNRTEAELGFFLPFGDGVWHVGPIAHLYKTEVRLIAEQVGTRPHVLEQPPSAGFWHDQTDREDLGFWLVNRGPIQSERDFSDAEVAEAAHYS
ncbi:MAG TPA: NAD(+) synthase, partial [Kineosporiaceae bacterium]|nr:NAD(+) synthase [Kineosporiaceae bacterium]